MRLRGSFGGGRDMAVDLGTANTLVFIRGRGIVLFEPSVVAFSEETGKVHAVGAEARRMIGRTPASIRATRPLRHGVIADFEITEQMLRHFITKAGGSRFAFARVVLCVPSGITDVERRAVDEATRSAGARAVYLIEEPMAAAIGANLKNVHKVLIGQETAEAAKIAVGSAWEIEDAPAETQVAGRDLVTGLLRRVALGADDVRRALEQPVARVIAAVKDTLERTPPELAADLGERGIRARSLSKGRGRGSRGAARKPASRSASSSSSETAPSATPSAFQTLKR